MMAARRHPCTPDLDSPVSIRDRRPSAGATHHPVILPGEQSQQAGTRLAIQIEMKNFERCHAIIDSLERGEELSAAPSEQELLETPLSEILTPRAANSLESIGVTTLADLLHQDPQRLLAIPNFGEKSLAEAQAAARKILGRKAVPNGRDA